MSDEGKTTEPEASKDMLCPFMSGFNLGPNGQMPQSRLAVAQAAPISLGVQFMGANCQREACALWSVKGMCCCLNKETT